MNAVTSQRHPLRKRDGRCLRRCNKSWRPTFQAVQSQGHLIWSRFAVDDDDDCFFFFPAFLGVTCYLCFGGFWSKPSWSPSNMLRRSMWMSLDGWLSSSLLWPLSNEWIHAYSLILSVLDRYTVHINVCLVLSSPWDQVSPEASVTDVQKPVQKDRFSYAEAGSPPLGGSLCPWKEHGHVVLGSPTTFPCKRLIQ